MPTEVGQRGCTGPISLLASAGQRAWVSEASSPVLRVRVGQVLRIVAPGRCGTAVQFGSMSGVLRSSTTTRQLTATRPGTAVVEVSHGMCAEEPTSNNTCGGGVDWDGDVIVLVTAA